MEMLRSPVAGPFKGKDITALAGKLKHVALNTPLRFSMEAMRPQSKNNSRFGNLSHHSFFSRHNPHPHRVTHIQGLNGAPICMVNDAWSVLTPLSPHPMIKGQVSTTVLGVPGAQMPIGDPHSNLVPRLTCGRLLDQDVEEPQRATQYSAETGRLIPPSSRATTRHTPHQLCRNNAKNKGKDAALSFQDQELVVSPLCSSKSQPRALVVVEGVLTTEPTGILPKHADWFPSSLTAKKSKSLGLLPTLFSLSNAPLFTRVSEVLKLPSSCQCGPFSGLNKQPEALLELCVPWLCNRGL
uniref:Thymus, brain and testes associated n=1 Tax=Chelydra serpentina TaxID=8475 RepID=A0A8C3SIV9_CHESE